MFRIKAVFFLSSRGGWEVEPCSYQELVQTQVDVDAPQTHSGRSNLTVVLHQLIVMDVTLLALTFFFMYNISQTLAGAILIHSP